MTQQSPWRAFPLTAAIALAGGLIFAALHAPLPWVLGPMSACAAAAAGGAKVALSANLRTPMVGLLGAYLGSRFDWATVAMMAANPWTAAGLLG